LKRVLLLILVVTILILAGCSSKPKHITNELYEQGIEVLELTDLYLSSKISSEELLEGTWPIIDSIEEIDLDNLGYSDVMSAKFLVYSSMSLIGLAAVEETVHNIDNYETILDARNMLAHALGID